MGSPINSFEIVESIRFLGALVSTEGISEEAKKTANKYINDLLKCLEKDVEETVMSRSDIQIVKSNGLKKA